MESDTPPSAVDDARRAVRLAAILVLVLASAGALAVFVIGKRELWREGVFYEQFASIEPPGIAILALFAVIVLLWLRRPNAEDAFEPRWLNDTTRTRFVIALAVLAITVVGTHLVFHTYLLYDDEYAGWIQSVVYSQGQRVGRVPAEWCPWITSLTPTSIATPKPCTWRVVYSPVHALFRGAFLAVRADAFAEPVLAALSVVLTVLLCRRIWPERPSRAVLAALFLAASTQFLVMAMTGFSMLAHLFLSLVWLWFYVRPERWALVLLPWVGVIALGVHSPFPHVLFVAPFLLRFLIQRRWVTGTYVASVYAIGLMFWGGRFLAPASADTTMAMASPAAVGGVVVWFAAHRGGDGMWAASALTLLATWSVPIAVLCALVALLLWRRLDGFTRWLALSLMCTLAGRAIFFATQGGGWGNRYAFAVLGNLAILAAIGTEFMAEALGRRRTYSLIAAALIVAIGVQLPMRGMQAERIVRPYYQTSRWLETLPADVVIFRAESVKWGQQLIRNDPFLRNTPKLMSFSLLGQRGMDSLIAMHPGRVKLVTRRELTAFGLKPETRIGRFEISP